MFTGCTHIPDTTRKTFSVLLLYPLFFSFFCPGQTDDNTKGKSIQCERRSKYFHSLDCTRGTVLQLSLTPIQHTEKIKALLKSPCGSSQVDICAGFLGLSGAQKLVQFSDYLSKLSLLDHLQYTQNATKHIL